MNFKRVFISKCIFVFILAMAVFSQNNVSPSAKYHSTSNAVAKRAALREIGVPASGQPAVPGTAAKPIVS